MTANYAPDAGVSTFISDLMAPESSGSNAFTGEETPGNFSWMQQAQAKSAGEQNLALYEAQQAALGKGPSIARSQLGQQFANAQAGAGALSSSAGGNLSPMARRQAMLATGNASTQLGNQAGLARSGEQAAAITNVGTLAGQGRSQDVALGGQEASAEQASQDLLLQQKTDADKALAAKVTSQNASTTQAMNDVTKFMSAGDVHLSEPAGGGGQDVGAGIHLMEPGGDGSGGNGNAHWIIREEPNFLLAVNAKDGKMRKILTGELTPEEHTQAMKKHGAGPIGSHHPDNLYVHDLNLGPGADPGSNVSNYNNIQAAPQNRPGGNAALPTDPTTGQASGTQLPQWGFSASYVNPNESWMQGLQAGNQKAQDTAFTQANNLAVGRGPSFGTQLAAQQQQAGSNAVSSLGASAMGRGAGEARGQAQTQNAGSQQQLGQTANVIRAADETAGMQAAGQLAGQSRAEDQALTQNAEAAAEKNKLLQLEARNEPIDPRQQIDTSRTNMAISGLSDVAEIDKSAAMAASSPQAKTDIKVAGDLDLSSQPAQGDDVDQFLAYHKSKISPGKDLDMSSGIDQAMNSDKEVMAAKYQAGEDLLPMRKGSTPGVRTIYAPGDNPETDRGLDVLTRNDGSIDPRVWGRLPGGSPTRTARAAALKAQARSNTLNSPAVGSPGNPADMDAPEPNAPATRPPSLDAEKVARGQAYLDQYNAANKQRDAEKIVKAKNVLYQTGGNTSQTDEGKRRRGEETLTRVTEGETKESKARREQLDEIRAFQDAEHKFGKKPAVGNKPVVAGDMHLGGMGKGGGYKSGPRSRVGEVETGAIGAATPKVSDALRSLSPYTFKYKNPEKNLSPKPAGTKYFGVMTTDMKKNPVAKNMVVGKGADEGFSIPAATSFNLAGEAHLQKMSDNHEKRLSRLEQRFLGAR